MDRFLNLSISFLHCKSKHKFFAFVWVSGLILGALTSVSADISLASTMRAALCGGMSIFGLLVVVLLTLFLSAYAVYFSQPVLLVSVVFLKAFLFAYTGAGLLTLYPSSGWLIRYLLMFSDTLMMPLLWWFWLCAESGERVALLHRTAFSTLVACSIGCVYYALIAPFLARLI